MRREGNEGAIVWMQAMTDFSGSPADTIAQPQTVTVATSVRAEAVSLVVSNRYGKKPVAFTAVNVRAVSPCPHAAPADTSRTAGARPGAIPAAGMPAGADAPAAARADGAVPVTFSGSPAVTVAPGAEVESDAVALALAPEERLAVSFLPRDGQHIVTRGSSIDRTLVEVAGDGAAPVDEPQYYYGLHAVRAYGAAVMPRRHVCFFGDSLTNQGRYTGEASRLLAAAHPDVTVCNCGISGNRLLNDGAGESLWTPSFGPAGLGRFERDITMGGALAPAAIFAMIGVNDLYQAGGCAPAEQLPSAAELIAGLEQLRVSAERLGAAFVAGTLTPFKGSVSHDVPAWWPEKERTRQEVNAYLRERGAVVDTDAIVRDPADPERLAAAFDCGDHLHFSAEGGRIIGRAVYESINRALAGDPR